MKNLPMPEVSLLQGCTHIPASQIVNHFLALKKDVDYYRAGIPKDWLRKDCKYACVFIAEVHALVKTLLRDNPYLPKDTRVVLGRIWSDGFQAHHIVARMVSAACSCLHCQSWHQRAKFPNTTHGLVHYASIRPTHLTYSFIF